MILIFTMKMIIKVMTLMWTTMLEIDEELNDQDDNDDKG